MLYKFLTVLSIFFSSIVFATDPNNLGEKRERSEDEDIVNNEPPAKKMAIFLLHQACEEGDIEKVKELLMTENINQKDGNGNTPILAACTYGQADIVELLLGEDYIKYININESNKQGYILLQLACEKLKDEKAQQIIEKITAHQHICVNYRDKQHDTALMIACIENNLAAIKALLKHPSIDVNFTDKNSCTPLHIACLNNKKEIVKLLLKNNKIKINETTKTFGHTALSIAITNSKPKIVKLLLKEKEIDIYKTGEYSDDEVPLNILIKIIKDNKEVNDNSELIIKAFVDYQWEKITNKDKQRIFDLCTKHKKTDLVGLILGKHDKKQKEINDFLLNSDSSKDEQIQNMLKSVIELNNGMEDSSSESENNFNIEDDFNINVEDLFLSACSNNDKDTLQMLIEKYKENNDNNNLYSRLLLKSSECNGVDNTELVRLLICNNADVNYRESNDGGPSPLHHACNQHNLKLVKLLVDNKADVNYRDNNDCTPLHCALDKQNLEIAKILIDNNPDVNSLLVTELLGEYPLDKVLKMYCSAVRYNMYNKDDLEKFIEFLLEKNALYSESFNEHNATKDLLEKIKTKFLADNTKSMW